MDLSVGEHCSVASCNVKDLLPIQCPRCTSHFCREHFGIDHHDCSGTSIIDGGSSSEQVSVWVKRSTCNFGDCNKPTLASAFDTSDGSKPDPALNDALCPQCSEAFCVTHRYPDAHACKGTTSSTSYVFFPDSKASQVETAKALLAKNFPETSKTLGSTSTVTAPAIPTPTSITKSKQPKDPAKLAKFKAVELIKMRHKASPGDPKDKNISVALDRRVHVYVSNEAGGEGGKPVLLWFRKDLICGRILDLLDVRFGLTKMRTLLVVAGEDGSEADARLDTAIGEQVLDGCKLIIRVRA